jgi:hypothetical protein
VISTTFQHRWWVGRDGAINGQFRWNWMVADLPDNVLRAENIFLLSGSEFTNCSHDRLFALRSSRW